MQFYSLVSIIYFVGCFLETSHTAPFTLPYRYPTPEEINSNKPITITNQPITESDIFIEQGVLQYLVNNNFLRLKYFNRWKELNQLTTLTPRQAIRMRRLKSRFSKAIQRFQRRNELPPTGVIDTAIIRIVFPIVCGTEDYVDEPITDEFTDLYNDQKKK
jgi:hypothetical protein